MTARTYSLVLSSSPHMSSAHTDLLLSVVLFYLRSLILSVEVVLQSVSMFTPTLASHHCCTNALFKLWYYCNRCSVHNVVSSSYYRHSYTWSKGCDGLHDTITHQITHSRVGGHSPDTDRDGIVGIGVQSGHSQCVGEQWDVHSQHLLTWAEPLCGILVSLGLIESTTA